MRTVVAFLIVAATAYAADPRVHRDLPYARTKDGRQTLDVYAPTEGQGHPVVFWIHGGGWQAGDKGEVDAKPPDFIHKGYVFVSVNYCLFPEATIKQMAGDMAKVLHWVHDHAREYGGDPETIFVTGHSAVAQLAALVCTDDCYLKAEGLSLSIVRGWVPVECDTYDVPVQIGTVVERTAGIYRENFGDEASQKFLSPVTHVARGKGPPIGVPAINRWDAYRLRPSEGEDIGSAEASRVKRNWRQWGS
jgi:arylformamidase